LNTQKQIVLIVALFFIFVGGCAAYTAIDLPVRASDQQKWTDEQSVERGALLYANNCRSCHGNKGDGGVGPTLNRADLQDQDPLLLRQSRELVRRTLQCGRAGTLMPAWLNTNGGALNSIQIEHLVNLITAPPPEWTPSVIRPTLAGPKLNTSPTTSTSIPPLSSAAIPLRSSPVPMASAPPARVAQQPPGRRHPEAGEHPEMPANRVFPDGYTTTSTRTTRPSPRLPNPLVGALIIADLGPQLEYKFTVKRGVATMELLTADGQPRAGLFP